MLLGNLLTAFASLREQRGRLLLSSLGVMVGTTAILLLVSIAIGVKADVTGQVEDIGVNVLVVLPARVEEGNFNPNMAGQSYLREEDAEQLRSVPGVLRTATLTFAGGGVSSEGKSAFPLVIAASPDWFRMHKNPLAEGRYLDESDQNAAVTVMGSVAKEALFGRVTALGKSVEINGRAYKVIGVTKDQKSSSSLFSMFGFQNVVYVPYRFLKSKKADMQIDRIMIQSAPAAEPKELKRKLEGVLGQRLEKQQYSVLTQEDLLGLVYKLMSILTWLLTGLTSIALFVGGVGIMTVMLMSVNERSKEIGIRKTVGARRRDIFLQFLAEAVLVTSIGGIAGLIFSYLGCLGLYYFTPVKPMVTIGTVTLSFGVSLTIGALFGLLPAMRAAGKDPVVAMRNE
jgi:putative ABC transport system permease protein